MKLDILMHYEINESTGDVTFIGKEEIKVDTGIIKKQASTINEDKPYVKLNANNYALNKKACDLLKLEVGDTVNINYPKKDGVYVPVIGSSKSFAIKSGNKLTKSLTVSYRSAANKKLAEFGDLFELEQTEREGIYYLIGNKPLQKVQKNAPIEIDETFELDDLNDVDIDNEDNLDISTIDLTL